MKVEMLFGGKTRLAVLEALSGASTPLTAYSIALSKGLDPAATYRCLAEYSEFGVVDLIKEQSQTVYTLSKGAGKAAIGYLRSLKRRAPEPADLEEWLSADMQAERMEKVAQVSRLAPVPEKAAEKSVDEILSMRVSGELSALAASSRIAFNELFEQKGGIFILRD